MSRLVLDCMRIEGLDDGAVRSLVDTALAHPARMQAVVGSTRPGRIREAAPGAELRLSRPEWYCPIAAAGYAVP